MSTPRAYVVCCAYALLPLVGGAAVLGGVPLAERVAIAGLAVVLNLLVAERVHGRFLAAAVSGSDPAGVGRFVLKQLTALPLAVVLAATLGPDALAAALGCVAVGAVVHALVQALHASDARLVAVALGTEA
jgi:hypothetical protein